jgi:hypothetical protein
MGERTLDPLSPGRKGSVGCFRRTEEPTVWNGEAPTGPGVSIYGCKKDSTSAENSL